MSDSYFFSFIIPVYKVEKYLSQCVDSILCQSYEDFEVILVDDGSPDTCPAICDSYAAQDPRVRVIHKKNGGLSSARNAAMPVVRGEYIIFLDSDDYWYSSDALLHLYQHICVENTDVIVLPHTCLYQGNSTPEPLVRSFTQKDFTSENYESRLVQLVSYQLFDTCAWNKAFRKNLLDTNDLSFREGIISEDLDWVARLSFAAKSVSILDELVHVYRKGRPGSITSSLKLKNLLDTKGSIFRCLDYPALKGRSEEFLQAYYSYVSYRYVIWLAESTLVKDPQVKHLQSEMREFRWLLNYDANKKVHLAKIASRFLGIRLTSRLLGVYLSRKL